MEEEASYIQMDHYISFLSNDKLDASEASTTISIQPSYADIPKLTNTKSTNQSGSNAGITEQNKNKIRETAPIIQERIIDKNDLVNLPSIYEDIVSSHGNSTQINIYENMIDLKTEPDGVSTHSNSTHISSNDKLHKTFLSTRTNKLALAILVGLVIIVPLISLIIWDVNSRVKVNKNAGPVINITAIDLTECLDKSGNYSEYCKDSIVSQPTGINTTSKNISLLMRHETRTRSGQSNNSPGNQKRTASIGLTAWATSMMIYKEGTTLIFNGMDGEHNDFDQSTGLFTCPITGIYYVYVTLMKYNIYNIYVDVFKMDSRIIRFSENDTGSPWNTVSNSALVSCSMGEIIQMKGWSNGSINGEPYVRYSSFSVIKVDQIAENSPDDTFVGYSAYANSQSLSDGDPVNFTNPLCNVGNQFSRNRFTCPYTGIYFVSVTYWTQLSTLQYSYHIDAEVYRGDTVVLWLYNYYKDSNNYYTNNALVRCKRGEYIEIKARTTSLVYGSRSYPKSIFTVMSVHQEDRSKLFIGFSRYKNTTLSYSAGDVITFAGIILDEENYFQANQFVCPVDGSYYFLLNLKKDDDENIEVNLNHGDQRVFKLEDTQISNSWNTISNSAVIRCLKGEVVKVVAARRGGVRGSRQTTFSGFLLFTN